MIRIQGEGNLATDPTVTTIGDNNTRVVEFRMRLRALARRRKDAPDWESLSDEDRRRDYQDRDRGAWVSVSCWDERFIDAIKNNLRKGNAVYIEGDLQARPFAHENGAEDVSLDIRAELVLPWLPRIDSLAYKTSDSANAPQ